MLRDLANLFVQVVGFSVLSISCYLLYFAINLVPVCNQYVNLAFPRDQFFSYSFLNETYFFVKSSHLKDTDFHAYIHQNKGLYRINGLVIASLIEYNTCRGRALSESISQNEFKA